MTSAPAFEAVQSCPWRTSASCACPSMPAASIISSGGLQSDLGYVPMTSNPYPESVRRHPPRSVASPRIPWCLRLGGGLGSLRHRSTACRRRSKITGQVIRIWWVLPKLPPWPVHWMIDIKAPAPPDLGRRALGLEQWPRWNGFGGVSNCPLKALQRVGRCFQN